MNTALTSHIPAEIKHMHILFDKPHMITPNVCII